MYKSGTQLIITKTPWVLGERKSFTLRSLKATDATQVSVLGHGGELLEYRPAREEAGFQYRRRKGVEELYTAAEGWTDTALVGRSTPGTYSVEVTGLKPDQAYEYRAMVKHPLLTVYAEERVLEPR